MTKTSWPLIIEPVPQKGSLNMAVDEFLFESLESSPGTILRFYAWERPTVSLGYSQKAEKVADLEFCRKNGVDIVRRMTGGKLVLHHREITYSLCSSDVTVFSSTVAESYSRISQGLMKGLELMGLKPRLADSPPQEYTRGVLPCFAHPARNEVEVKGKKIIGSAQKRIGDRFLQHGSIPLENDEDLLQAVSVLPAAKNPLRVISLSEALGRPATADWAVPFFVRGMTDFFGVSFVHKTFQPRDHAEIARIEVSRYASPDWTFRGGGDTISVSKKANTHE